MIVAAFPCRYFYITNYITMKSFFALIALLAVTGIAAQTKTIYGKVTKSDGSRIKGTSTMKGYEDQLIITNYTGGTDNTATIEIEVPTNIYIATFRGMINTAQPVTLVAKPTATSLKSANTSSSAMPERTITQQSLQAFPISKIEISVTNRVNNSVPTLSNQIILENVRVESCTDNVASGTSKIALKASRIGWIYFNIDARTGKLNSINKSGWDTVAGTAWNNF